MSPVSTSHDAHNHISRREWDEKYKFATWKLHEIFLIMCKSMSWTFSCPCLDIRTDMGGMIKIISDGKKILVDLGVDKLDEI